MRAVEDLGAPRRLFRKIFLLSMFLPVLVCVVGCSHRPPVDSAPCQNLEERTFTQEGVLALTGLGADHAVIEKVSVDDFLNRYFSVFFEHDEALGLRRWAWAAFGDGGMYLDNLLPASSDWFAAMDVESAWETTGSIDSPGISLVTTSLRAMPSDRRLVGGSANADRGIVFDQLQNSLVNANEPLWLSHRSRSGEWFFVFTSYASGWVHSQDAAVLPAGQEVAWPHMPPVVCIKEGVAVRDHNGRFLFDSRIGMVLPQVGRGPGNSTVLVATGKNSAGEAHFEVVAMPEDVAVAMPAPATAAQFSLLAARLLDLPYGWGGLNENRDCSAAIRDLLMPFGVWLPRNSSQQAKMGEVIDLSGFGDAEKADLILERGVPFATLVYKKGHVALYVGHHNGMPLVFHSVWDLTVGSGKELKRKHIGRVVLSPLRSPAPGEHCDDGSTLLSDLESMNILAHEPHNVSPLNQVDRD